MTPVLNYVLICSSSLIRIHLPWATMFLLIRLYLWGFTCAGLCLLYLLGFTCSDNQSPGTQNQWAGKGTVRSGATPIEYQGLDKVGFKKKHYFVVTSLFFFDTYIHAYIHACAYTCIHTYIHTCIHTCICACINTYIY